MRIRIPSIFFIAIGLIFSSSAAKAQAGLCPPNLDFELGNFNNWVCDAGGVTTPGGVNTYTPVLFGPQPGRHTIISAASGAGTDPWGGFPKVCPNGSQYSVQLGNSGTGSQAERISYTYAIPSTLSLFSMIFHYAVVVQNPNHTTEAQPRFRAKITDLSTGTPIPCVNFDFIAGSAMPGFVLSPFSTPANAIYYKDWTPITINLNAYIGRTIKLEFLTSDCTQGGHFGYAYIDVNTNCNGAIAGTTICQGENSINLSAPYGFQFYEWYSDITFTTLVSTAQSLPLTPAPSVGTIIPVIVTPYTGFGCKDTLYATITVAPKPVSRAGPDKIICNAAQTQIGAAPTIGYNYLWTPASQVSNPVLADPFAWNNPPTPMEFIVKTTDVLTGCFSYDTTVISNAAVDTAIRANGSLAFCLGGASPTLSVNPGSVVQWYDGNTSIPGANSITYQPTGSGSFWAEVTQGGCIDSTATIPVSIYPLPLASFTANKDTGCLSNHSFQFTNTSAVSSNEGMSHNWKFSDGSSQQVTDAVKTFAAKGTYNVKLVTTTSSGCKDSTTSIVYVLPNGIPNFTYDSICTNRPVLFRNLSNENGSSLVNYSWNFNNGGPPVLIKNPLPVTYSTSGTANVTLQLTALGCETNLVTMTKSIPVNSMPSGMRYRDLTVPQGSSAFIHVRDMPGGSYSWRPQLQLSSYNAKYAEFYATGNDVKYYIDMVDKHTCVTTDTMLVQVLKKPGFYLPTGFTPNGDGLNDVAKPYLVGMKSLKSFSVYNRWGDRLFYSTTYGEGWDGRYRGMVQSPGVYVWILEFYNIDDKLITEKGTIALIK